MQLLWGSANRAGCAVSSPTRQGLEAPLASLKKPSKLFNSQPMRITASLVLTLIFIHLALSHKEAHHKHDTATLITLPETHPVPKQVELLQTSPEEMPLFYEDEEVLGTGELRALQDRLLNSSWVQPLGRRAGRMGTKGVTVTLNTGGIEKLEQAANLTDLATFFGRERAPTANAWVLSLVAIETCAGFVADQGIWSVHQDCLASSAGEAFETRDSVTKLVPHSISVFFVYVPDSLNGGSTWLWHSNDTGSAATPAAIVQPRTNTKLTIRGDAVHGVSGQNASQDSLPVLSLVLEQYKVPTALYSQTQEFRVQTFRTEYRAKRPDLMAYRPFNEEQKAAAAAALPYRVPTPGPSPVANSTEATISKDAGGGKTAVA